MNLDLLGTRERDVYGKGTLKDLDANLRAEATIIAKGRKITPVKDSRWAKFLKKTFKIDVATWPKC